MARNWGRVCKLLVNGQGVTSNLGDLRVVFEIKASSIQSPNAASFRVYNVAPTTVAKLKQKEFTSVEFYAGYQDHSGLVYKGTIKQAATGHETATDSYVDIFCADGDAAYNRAVVSKTLAAGWTHQDKLQAALDAMAPLGVTMGYSNVDLTRVKFPRGLPLSGMAREIIREVASSNGATWSIQDGKVNVIDGDKPIGTSTFAMNSQTGMIGWPQQTEDGVVVQSLLNSALRPDTIVQIDQNSINEAEQDNNPFTGAGSQTNFNLAHTGLIAADGRYRIIYMTRRGDTRGQEWFDISTCIAVSGGSENASELQTGYLGYS